MSTYKKIAEFVKDKHHVTVKSCHIAHCKELFGLPRKNSHNRRDPSKRVYECPEKFRPFIQEAFFNFGLLKK